MTLRRRRAYEDGDVLTWLADIGMNALAEERAVDTKKAAHQVVMQTCPACAETTHVGDLFAQNLRRQGLSVLVRSASLSSAWHPAPAATAGDLRLHASGRAGVGYEEMMMTVSDGSAVGRLVCVLLGLTLLSGCPWRTGKCSPGPTTRWMATVERVELADGYGTVVTRKGRSLMVRPELVRRCREQGRLGPGSSVTVESHSNGPCPPNEEVVDCP